MSDGPRSILLSASRQLQPYLRRVIVVFHETLTACSIDNPEIFLIRLPYFVMRLFAHLLQCAKLLSTASIRFSRE